MTPTPRSRTAGPAVASEVRSALDARRARLTPARQRPAGAKSSPSPQAFAHANANARFKRPVTSVAKAAPAATAAAKARDFLVKKSR